MSCGVLFDLDGTLVDTTFVHTVCWAEALRQHGRDVPMAELHHAIGLPGGGLLDRFAPDLDDAERDAVSASHATLYRQWRGRVRRQPGARELLQACHELGLTVVLASSARPDDLRALRAVLDVDEAIAAATDAGSTDNGKPAPDPIVDALRSGGLEPDEAVYVGDAVWDGEAARRAGVEFVGLTCGGTPANELARAGATGIYSTPEQLLAALPQTPLGALLRRSGHDRVTNASPP